MNFSVLFCQTFDALGQEILGISEIFFLELEPGNQVETLNETFLQENFEITAEISIIFHFKTSPSF